MMDHSMLVLHSLYFVYSYMPAVCDRDFGGSVLVEHDPTRLMSSAVFCLALVCEHPRLIFCG